MPYKDKEKMKEKKRQYYENNKEIHRELMKQYRENNKEKIAEQQKQYRETNKEKRNKYNQTPKRIKSNRILNWNRSGVKLPDDYPDWSLFYDEEYVKTTKCEECGVELTEDKHTTPTRKCLDHCHITGEFRNIICHACNTKRG